MNANRTNAAQSQEPGHVSLHCILQYCPYNCSLWPTWYKNYQIVLRYFSWVSNPAPLHNGFQKETFQKEACRIWGSLLLSSWLYSLFSLGLPTPAMRVWDVDEREGERLVSYQEQGRRLPLGQRMKVKMQWICMRPCSSTSFEHVAASHWLQVSFPKHCLIPGNWHTAWSATS